MNEKHKIYLTLEEVIWIQSILGQYWLEDDIRDVLRLLSLKIPPDEGNTTN